MTSEEKRIDEECQKAILNPEMPDDPDENAEFEIWVYFENGKRIETKRPNPRFRKLAPGVDRSRLV